MFDARDLEVDHEHPASWGGADADSNYVTACRDCNRAKAGRPVRPLTPEEQREVLFRSLLEPDNRSAQRQMVALDRGDIPTAKIPKEDFIHRLATGVESAERGNKLREKRQLMAIQRFLEGRGLLL